MNLNKLVLDKIKSLGATKSAAYFGVSVPTIYSWKQKKNPPIAAVQKIIDDGNLDSGLTSARGRGPKTTIQSITPIEQPEVGSEMVHAKNEAPVSTTPQMVGQFARIERQLKHYGEGLEALTHAVLRGDARQLRFWAMKSTDPDAQVPITSGIVPFRNPESGMQVKSAAEIIGQAPQPVNMPKDDGWNEPENAAPNRAPDWNAKINPTDDKNRDSDWNKPEQKQS